MTTILTNDIEANSFLGLVTKGRSKNNNKFTSGRIARKIFVKVESREVLMNLAIATVVIVMGLTAGSISQEKIELAQYAAPASETAV